MVTVILKLTLSLGGVNSLKEKRRIVKSLLARIKNDFNVSISEVGQNDTLRQAVIGAAIVSNDSAFGHQVISKLVNKIENNPEVTIIDYVTENY